MVQVCYHKLALFLEREKNDFTGADVAYQKALALDDTEPNLLLDYAAFLCTYQNDESRAKQYTDKALQMLSKSHLSLRTSTHLK